MNVVFDHVFFERAGQNRGAAGMQMVPIGALDFGHVMGGIAIGLGPQIFEAGRASSHLQRDEMIELVIESGVCVAVSFHLGALDGSGDGGGRAHRVCGPILVADVLRDVGLGDGGIGGAGFCARVDGVWAGASGKRRLRERD